MNLVVVGLGYVGLPLAVSAAKSGHRVHGYDLDNQKILDLKIGQSFTTEVSTEELIKLQSDGQISFISELVKQNEKTIYVIAVPTPLDSDKAPDLTILKKACAGYFIGNVFKFFIRTQLSKNISSLNVESR